MKKKFFTLISISITLLILASFLHLNVYSASSSSSKYLSVNCYQQTDPIWAHTKIGGNSIGDTACGIFALVNAVNYLTGNMLDPIETATWAHEIKAYNYPSGTGTWRWVLYGRINEKYPSDAYGFKVVNAGRDSGVKNNTLKSHLQNGGVAVAHVPGHFIALVEYDKDSDKFLVYDSAASQSRNTKDIGTWLSSAQLSGSIRKMTVDWWCLISRTTNTLNHLDSVTIDCENEKVCTTIYSNGRSKIPVSGWSLSTSGVAKYTYTIDYKDTYSLRSKTANNITSIHKEYANCCEDDKCGFYGEIDISSLQIGTHTIIINAENDLGGFHGVAQIKLVVDKSPDDNNNTVSESENTYESIVTECHDSNDIQYETESEQNRTHQTNPIETNQTKEQETSFNNSEKDNLKNSGHKQMNIMKITEYTAIIFIVSFGIAAMLKKRN